MTTASQPTPTVPSARWWRVGFLLFVVYLVAFMERSNISVAAPAITKELDLATTATGIILSAFFWGYIVTQVPGGWAANKCGPTRVITAALLIWSGTALGQALAGSYTELLLYRVLMGLSEGVVWPAFGVLFVAWFPVSERARATGLAMLALPLSSVIMAPTAGWIISTWDWRTMFIIQGIPALILAVIVPTFLRDNPAGDKRLTDVEREYIHTHREDSVDETETGSFLNILKSPTVWACCIVYFLWLTGFYSFGLWLPTVLKQLSNQGIGMVGLLSVIPYGIAGVALLLNARAADRSSKGKAPFIIVPLVLGTLALLLQQMLPTNLGFQLVFLIVTGVGVYGAFGPWWAWALEHLTSQQAGPGYGLINLFGNFGGIVGPIVVGYAASGGPVADGLYILGIFLLVGALMAIGIARFGHAQSATDTSLHPEQSAVGANMNDIH